MEVAESFAVLNVQERETHFRNLYERAFPGVARFVRKMNGSLEDASDIFQDALVIFYEKSLDENFTIVLSEEAYIVGIAKHLWVRKFSEHKNHISLDASEVGISIPEDYFATVDDNRLVKFLERAGKKCMDLLQSFYMEKISLQEIAETFGFSTLRSATVQKHKCLEKLRNTLKEKSIRYEDFLE